jgi:hypothetical protein
MMRYLLIFLLLLLYLLLAGTANAQSEICEYPIGPLLDAPDGTLTFCTPNSLESGDAFTRNTITCNVVVDDTLVYTKGDLSPGVPIPLSLPELRGAKIAEIYCGYIFGGVRIGGIPWTGVVTFPGSKLGPPGALPDH